MEKRMRATRTVSVPIECPADETYAFVRDPENLPRWASGIGTSVRREGDRWIIDTDKGPVQIAFADDNLLGVLDHVVTTADGRRFYNAMRVVPNDDACVVLFTVVQFDGLSEAQFAEDVATVARDLDTLRTVLTT